jgi:hypothetical protein
MKNLHIRSYSLFLFGWLPSLLERSSPSKKIQRMQLNCEVVIRMGKRLGRFERSETSPNKKLLRSMILPI